MLDNINPENLVCIDIETVPCFPQFNDCPDDLKELYLKKSERLKLENENNEEPVMSTEDAQLLGFMKLKTLMDVMLLPKA